jgi:formiminotetrahydrofolate cyclodeaminase
MTSYSNVTLSQLLDAFASNDPVPGGGSAAALAGAVGVSLLIMVGTLPKTKSGTAEDRSALAAAVARLRPLRDRLAALVDRDSQAYASVVEAYRLPKNDDAQKAARRQAIERAMQEATETPLETMRAGRQALEHAETIAANGSAAAASDVAVAIELLRAAVRGASFNVDTNLSDLKDVEYVQRARSERAHLVHGL